MKRLNRLAGEGIVPRTKKALRALRPSSLYWFFQRKWGSFDGIARLVAKMAESGYGTDACLRHGCLPMRVHFYSPVPDIRDLGERKVWENRSLLPGVDFQGAKQLHFLKELGRQYGRECKWPLKPTGDPADFHTVNGCFSYGCAASLHTMIRYLKPRQLIEIGSGFSSRVISGAVKCNSDEGNPCQYVIVDPYPGEVITGGRFSQARLIQERVELLEAETFEALGENDILFIDSGHTVRTGSDVNFLFLEVLPRLRPGVVIHIHDICLPYEYPEVYFTNPGFRVFWTEAYLLQAFLAFNSEFEVLLAMNFIQTDHMDEFCEAFPLFNLKENWANSGSFWIRRKANG
jgi:hypothetical protein